MKTFKLGNITIIIFLAFTITSCKKSTDDAVPHFRLNPEELKYVQLPLNKYFIYKDSASGALDSVVVTTSTLNEQFLPAGPIGVGYYGSQYAENYNLILSKVNGGSSAEWFNGNALAFSVRANPVSVHLLEQDLNSAFRFPACVACGDASFSSLTIEGEVYHEVVYILGNINRSTTSNYYWSKGVGIIKRIIKNGTNIKTYTLLRHG